MMRMINTDEVITPLERDILRSLGNLTSKFGVIVANGPTRQADMTEIVGLIHQLQRMVSSQALGRIFPNEYRLLGSVCGEKEE